MTGIAFRREPLPAPARSKPTRWALGASDRGGQDKSRKVRPVGRSGNLSDLNHASNIAKTLRRAR
jgi:hypothetical protein